MSQSTEEAPPTAKPAESSPDTVDYRRPGAETATPKDRPVVKGLVQGLLVLVFLGAGAAMFALLVWQKTAPSQANTLDAAPVVRVAAVNKDDFPVQIVGYGQVQPRDRVQVVPQVEGRVIETADDFAIGGTLRGGEVVVKLDATDAELTLRQQQAALDRIDASLSRMAGRTSAAQAVVAQAQTQLETQQAEADVARSQYERLNPGQDVPTLVAREPQVREAEAALASAEADLDDVGLQRDELLAERATAEATLERAQVDRDRLEVTLPGDANDVYRVTDKSAEVGQFITRGQSIAMLYRASSLEVPVPLAARQLQWFDVPGASVTLADESTGRSWSGIVTRTQGEIDPRSRLINVIVTADDPDRTLVPGLFLKATIDGQTIPDVAAVPRLALRQESQFDARPQRTGGAVGADQMLFVVEDGVLRFKPVEVAYLDRETAYVHGLDDDAAVITTDLKVVTDGMKVTVVE